MGGRTGRDQILSSSLVLDPALDQARKACTIYYRVHQGYLPPSLVPWCQESPSLRGLREDSCRCVSGLQWNLKVITNHPKSVRATPEDKDMPLWGSVTQVPSLCPPGFKNFITTCWPGPSLGQTVPSTSPRVPPLWERSRSGNRGAPPSDEMSNGFPTCCAPWSHDLTLCMCS